MSDFSDEVAIRTYEQHKSVHKAAVVLGVSHSRLHRRLVALGHEFYKKGWSDAEDVQIRDYYRTTPTSDFCLSDLVNSLPGRTRSAVAHRASKLGLTDVKRSPNSGTLKKMAHVTEERWRTQPHPKGMAGKKHTEEFKATMSTRVKRDWATWKAFEIGPMSQEARQRRSDLATVRMSKAPASQAYSRCKSGYREDLGKIYFRSAWEANYARFLNYMIALGAVEWWEYEPETFWFEAIKRGVRSYKPDFRVKWTAESPRFVEVKGWMDPKSKTKLKRMKKYHPGVIVEVVGNKEYQGIKRKWSSFIQNWE